MCMFSREVRFVGATKILARALPGGGQVLAYSMAVEAQSDLAMVLPLPYRQTRPKRRGRASRSTRRGGSS